MSSTKFIRLKVHADSKKACITQKTPESFELWVKAPPERGLANIEALSLLAKQLSKNPKQLRIIKGAHSPSKIIEIYADSPAAGAGEGKTVKRQKTGKR